MRIKQKVRIKIQQMNIDFFSNLTLLESIYYLFNLYNEANNAKRFNARKYYLPNGKIKNYHVIINGKNFYGEPIDSDTKQYKDIRKLTTGESDDCFTGCLLDYEYIKNYYGLIAVDFSRQKVLHADRKAIQHIKFVGQLRKLAGDGNATDAGNYKSMFVLTIQ